MDDGVQGTQRNQVRQWTQGTSSTSRTRRTWRTRRPGRIVALTVVSMTLGAAVAATPTAAGADGEGQAASVGTRAAVPTEVRLGPATGPSVVGALQPSAPARLATTATFRITYTGFTPEARAAFQRAADIWATRISSNVPITVQANFKSLPTNVLGSAGPGVLLRDFPGAPRPGTWYPEAMANKLAGRQLDSGADVRATFSSSFGGWWFGAGAAPDRKVDFTAVVLHELGHGLGFVGAGDVVDGRGSVRLDGRPTTYDRFTENTAGTALLSFSDPSARLADQLTSGGVYFDSRKVREANSGRRARLFAPANWQPGSSYSHLNEATYKPGTRNALMTPRIGPGETVRVPGPITGAIFASMGW